jgi:hypothetical protein
MANFVGKVYDLDFISAQGSCQVLMTDGRDELIARTADQRVQSFLQTAFSIGSLETSVDYIDGHDWKWIVGVRVNAKSNQKGGVRQVELSPEFPYCRAEIEGQTVDVIVLDPRLEGILLTAIASPGAKFDYNEEDGRLTRAKVNLG